jgi:hypothetical protein
MGEVGRGLFRIFEGLDGTLDFLNREVTPKNNIRHSMKTTKMKENIFFIGIPYNYLK